MPLATGECTRAVGESVDLRSFLAGCFGFSAVRVDGQMSEGAIASRFMVNYAAILHFSFRLGPGISDEMALYVVYGANFTFVLHHLSSLTRFKGVLGPPF